jgi:hypothetical protein
VHILFLPLPDAGASLGPGLRQESVSRFEPEEIVRVETEFGPETRTVVETLPRPESRSRPETRFRRETLPIPETISEAETVPTPEIISKPESKSKTVPSPKTPETLPMPATPARPETRSRPDTLFLGSAETGWKGGRQKSSSESDESADGSGWRGKSRPRSDLDGRELDAASRQARPDQPLPSSSPSALRRKLDSLIKESIL